MGNYDEARDKLVTQAREMPIKWGLFDETPDKVGEAIAKSRPKMAAGTVVATNHNKATAIAKLKEARADCWKPTSTSPPRQSPSTWTHGV